MSRKETDKQIQTKGTVRYRNAFTRFWLKNRRHHLKVLVSVALVVVFCSSVAVGLIIDKKLDLINIDSDGGLDFRYAQESDVYDEDEELAFEPVHDVTDADSLNDWLKKWATNGGEKLHSKNVVNCLLCGIDSEDGSISGGRADAMVLLSLNKKTDTITLISFMRDAYTYMDINGDTRYYKVNSSYNWGGPATLIETLENNYKIEIDKYVCMDFDTFPKAINALGGIEVEVQEYEAKYINRTTKHTIDYGENVVLDGWEALVFTRIRYSDSNGDISRTRRQRQVVTSMLDSVKNASAGQLNNMMNLLLPYVRTNYTKSQLLSLSTQAIMQGWMNYGMSQVTSPLVEANETETEITGRDSYIQTNYGYVPEFVWVVDYQLEAQRLQLLLYDTTNIELHDDRVSPFDFTQIKSYNTETTTAYNAQEYSPSYGDGSTRYGGYASEIIDRFFGTEETTESDDTYGSSYGYDSYGYDSYDGNYNDTGEFQQTQTTQSATTYSYYGDYNGTQ